jgi:hypothetical protein
MKLKDRADSNLSISNYAQLQSFLFCLSPSYLQNSIHLFSKFEDEKQNLKKL